MNFPGCWATTPGKYYWQADHVPLRHDPEAACVSVIKSFRVTG